MCGVRDQRVGEPAREGILAPSSGLTLLIVDDEPSIARGLTTLFQRRGYAVVAALSAGDALRILHTVHLDGLLIDFRIPDMRGDVLFAAAVAIQPHLAQRTIFLTGDISDAVPEALVDAQRPIVLKPFELAELERVVMEVIGAASGEPRGRDEAAGAG